MAVCLRGFSSGLPRKVQPLRGAGCNLWEGNLPTLTGGIVLPEGL